MKKLKYYIGRGRQSRSLHGVAMIILWMAMLTWTPQVDFTAFLESSPIQRVLPLDSTPAAPPSILLKSSTEYAEFSFIVLGVMNFENHLPSYSLLEQSSSEYARTYTSVLLYTQTTSSFL